MAFEAVTDEMLADIMASSRDRGVYKRELANLNGERAVRVSFTEGAFKGKNFETVYQGLGKAIKDNEEFSHLQVKRGTVDDEKILVIINTEA